MDEHRTLSERVTRIENFLGECGMDRDDLIDPSEQAAVIGRPAYREAQARQNQEFTDVFGGVASNRIPAPATAFEDLFKRIQDATDRITQQANKLFSIGDRILGPLPENGEKAAGDVNVNGTLDQAFFALNWLDGAIARLEAAAARLERI